MISCLVSDIDFRVSLAPDAAGCAVDIDVSHPRRRGRIARTGVRAVVAASLVRLAERTAAGTSLG